MIKDGLTLLEDHMQILEHKSWRQETSTWELYNTIMPINCIEIRDILELELQKKGSEDPFSLFG